MSAGVQASPAQQQLGPGARRREMGCSPVSLPCIYTAVNEHGSRHGVFCFPRMYAVSANPSRPCADLLAAFCFALALLSLRSCSALVPLFFFRPKGSLLQEPAPVHRARHLPQGGGRGHPGADQEVLDHYHRPLPREAGQGPPAHQVWDAAGESDTRVDTRTHARTHARSLAHCCRREEGKGGTERGDVWMHDATRGVERR